MSTVLVTKAQIDYGEADFRRSIRAEVHSLWDGSHSLFDFVDGMFSAITHAYQRAWNEGARSCGILPNERSPQEEIRLNQEINGQITYIWPFADDIQRNSKANGGKITPLYNRADGWVNRYVGIRSIARSMACGDRKEVWRVRIGLEHCTDCLRVDGKVYRASVWDRYGWVPRSSALACFGNHCGCDRIPTDLPVTPGRPPSLSRG